MNARSTHRISRVLLGVTLAVLPVLIWFASQVKLSTAQVEKWLPQQSPSLTAYREFRERFGEDQYLIISWQSAKLTDQRIPLFTSRLDELKTLRPELAIEEVVDSQRALAFFAKSRSDLDEEQVVKRLSDVVMGRDQTPFISVTLASSDVDSRAMLIEEVERIAEELGLAKELIMAGEPYQVHIIDQASKDTMQRFVAPSSVLALLACFACLKSIRLTLTVFAFAGLGQLVGLAIIGIFFGKMSAVLVVLPTLVFMLTLSASVHLVSYYIDAGGPSKKFASVRALRIGFIPCALAALTTILGFGSLAVSQLSPVWQFGSLSALGLFIATALLLADFPALMPGKAKKKEKPTSPQADPPIRSNNPWLRMADWIVTRALMISAFGIALLIWGFSGLSFLKTSTRFDDMFAETSPAVSSLRWVEDKLGPVGAIEFVLKFQEEQPRNDNGLDVLHTNRIVATLAKSLEQEPGVRKAVSAATFLPLAPLGGGLRNATRRSAIRHKIEASLPQLQEQHYLSVTNEAQYWRLSLRVEGLDDNNFASVLEQLKTTASESLGASSAALGVSPPTLEVTGLRSLMEDAHKTLITDLVWSFSTAFLLITPVMIFVTRSILGGLLVMIPNILPVAFVFGTMGWIGVQLDVASILTASVALGIAVDDTLHFMSWFLRGLRTGQSKLEAAKLAIAHCARPMLSTTCICTGAMLPFLFCEFIPTSKFACLMIMTLSGAIIGDLILLPAVLVLFFPASKVMQSRD